MREELKPNYLTRGPRYTEILDLCMAMALDLGPEVFERQSIALRDRPDQQETLAGCGCRRCPLRARGCALPGGAARADARSGRGLTARVVEEAGHMPTLERPEAVSRAMANWLAA
jgi:hypothetical protein